jgi:hypothetical protein
LSTVSRTVSVVMPRHRQTYIGSAPACRGAGAIRADHRCLPRWSRSSYEGKPTLMGCPCANGREAGGKAVRADSPGWAQPITPLTELQPDEQAALELATRWHRPCSSDSMVFRHLVVRTMP